MQKMSQHYFPVILGMKEKMEAKTKQRTYSSSMTITLHFGFVFSPSLIDEKSCVDLSDC